MDPRRHRICPMCDAPVEMWEADVHIRACVWIAARISAREDLEVVVTRVDAVRRRWGR